VQGSCPVYQDTASGAYWFGLCDLNGISRPSQAYSVQITASPGSSGTGPTGFAFDYTCGPAAVTVAGQTLTGETACSVSGVTLGGNCPPAGSIKVSG
jgi:hypothetical protein